MAVSQEHMQVTSTHSDGWITGILLEKWADVVVLGLGRSDMVVWLQ